MCREWGGERRHARNTPPFLPGPWQHRCRCLNESWLGSHPGHRHRFMPCEGGGKRSASAAAAGVVEALASAMCQQQKRWWPLAHTPAWDPVPQGYGRYLLSRLRRGNRDTVLHRGAVTWRRGTMPRCSSAAHHQVAASHRGAMEHRIAVQRPGATGMLSGGIPTIRMSPMLPSR
jgi:hypothetical protein